MKAFYRICALVLICALLFSGCARVPQTKEEDQQKLIAILDDIAANFHPGTAGNSLSSLRIAGELTLWASSTNMSKQEVGQVVAQWLQAQSPQIRQSLSEKFTSIQESFRRIAADGTSKLLEDAGVQGDLPHLNSQLKELVEAILSSGGLD